jgi:hypothetical protein
MHVVFTVFIALLALSSGRQLQEVEGEKQGQEPQCSKQEASWDFTACTQNSGEQSVTSRGGTTRISPLLGLSLGAGSLASSNAAAGATAEIGFHTGGAQDVENFRENINNGYLPLPTDVSYGGIVKDYYFDTSPSTRNSSSSCKDLFCPIYSASSTADPLLVTAYEGRSKDLSNQLYLAVGLDSALPAEDVQRKPLNLVLLLDYSGSMSSLFNAYYYDMYGNMKNTEGKFIFIY